MNMRKDDIVQCYKLPAGWKMDASGDCVKFTFPHGSEVPFVDSVIVDHLRIEIETLRLKRDRARKASLENSDISVCHHAENEKLRAEVAAKDRDIAELTAKLELETQWFWKIVDRNGLNNVSSDEDEALEELVKGFVETESLRAELDTAKREIAHLKQEVSERDTEISLIQMQLSVNDETQKALDEISYLKSEIDEFSDERKEIEKTHSLEITKLTTEIDGLRAEVEAWREAFTEYVRNH